MTVIKHFFLILLLTGCAMKSTQIKTVGEVDINRFMGDWYVLAHIPSYVEKNAFNAVESYKLNEDGSIATTFTFNEGSINGPVKTYHPKGFVIPGTNNAEWGMQFIWPIKAQYKIVYLDKDYNITIVARDKLDYVWLMARTKTLPHDQMIKFRDMIEDMGYSLDNYREIGQE